MRVLALLCLCFGDCITQAMQQGTESPLYTAPKPLAEQITLTPEEQQLSDSYTFDELFAQGRTYKVAGDVITAMHYLKPALLKRPQDWAANWDLGDLYLALGDYEKGFAGFRFRWQHEPCFQKKLWRGEPLQGKTILIYCQWGLGDTFMYIRYAAELKKLGATVICSAQKPLANILWNCPFIDRVVTSSVPEPPFDFQVPITYLPEVFNTTVDTIPVPIPYLCIDPILVTLWKKRLGPRKKYRVGLCWQGAVREDPQTHGRSIKLKELLPLLSIPHIEWYSLQQGYGTEQVQELPAGCSLHLFNKSFDREHGPFVDTAALMKNLDLVITVDTSIAHLAGALGVPVWVMLQYASEWRFLLERSDSPWYPSMRLFRQSTGGTWQTVVAQLAEALTQMSIV